MGILSSNMETPANQKRSSKAWAAAQHVHELCVTAFPARDTSECPNHSRLNSIFRMCLNLSKSQLEDNSASARFRLLIFINWIK